MHLRGWILLAPLVPAGLLLAAPASALETCINGPSSYGGTIDQASIDAVIALHPRCARVGYRQDTSADPFDPALLARFDALVAQYEAAGVEPYMLIHTESFAMDPHAPDSPATRAAFVADAAKLVDHFKPHVRRFEIYNEPNNWDATKMPVVSADAFAATLAGVYTAVKVDHPNDACWNVDLASGALFAFHQSDGSGGSASDYLAQTYAAGIAGYDWDGIKQKTGSYPLDGIGWHFYMEETTAQATASQLSTYLGQIWGTVTQYEGNGATKSIWISEMSFPTDGSVAQDDSQAQSLDSLYDAVASEPHVAMGMWFTFQDFDASGWGLYRAGGFDAAHAKPSRDRFVAQAAQKIDGLWAKLAFVPPPATVAPGQRVTLAVAATNLGSEAWTRAGSVRLGAGAGCPLTPDANALLWSPSDGYANGASDARVFLGASDSVATGQTHAFTFDVVAPSAPGRYVLSARMVKEGVAWFGSPGEVTLNVAAPSAADGGGNPSAADGGATPGMGGSQADGGAPPSADASAGNGVAAPGAFVSSSGGCTAGGNPASACGAILVALLALARRSRLNRSS